MISEEETAFGLTTIRELITSWEPHPTFFEIVTALALLHFRERRAEFVVLETGMGGRLDATNAMQPIVSVITPIDFDHEKWLGHSLTSIAREKAGIIKPKIPVVSAPQHPEAEEVICARATECGAPFRFVRQNFRGEIALSGEHQRQNASLAIAVLRAAQIETSEDAIARGLHSVTWPARFQRWDERTVIDGAHNPAGARVLAETWQQTFPGEKATLILAALVDKDLPQICAALAPIADFILLPKIRSARAVEPDTLAELLASLPCSISPSIDAALATARARPNPILITGSLHFAGEVLAHLQGVPAAYEECLQ
jgi:dihydrofolate synthase/folylpolyglutamate synthase